jgi:hypothetical protein
MAAIESKTRPGRGACSCLRPLSGEWKATMGCKMVILWWYYGDTLKTKTELYIYIYTIHIYSYCILVKWYFYLQKCGCWPSMIGTNPCSPSVKTGLPRPRGIRWTGGEGEWVHNELVVTIWEKQGASGSCVEILYIYIYLYWLYI